MWGNPLLITADLLLLLLHCTHPLGFTQERLCGLHYTELCSSASVGHSDGKASGQEQNNDVETGAERAQGWDTAPQAGSDPESQGEKDLDSVPPPAQNGT